MNAGLPVVAALLLVATTARAQVLEKLGLDDPSSAGPRIEADAVTKVEGTASLKIVAPSATTIYLGEVAGPDVEDAKLVYSARVRSELDGAGAAFLEMWVQVGDGKYFSRGMNDAVRGRSDWKAIRTPFLFQKGQRPDKVTLNLVISGTGTVWVDDVVLSREPLEQD